MAFPKKIDKMKNIDIFGVKQQTPIGPEEMP
jgi:hypothetical protein